MSTFGGQTVTFVAVTETGDAGYLGLKTKARAGTAVEGCQFQPAKSQETPDGQTNVATEVWRCTAPPDAAVLAASPGDELTYDGDTFEVDGPILLRHKKDGSVHHVTIMCKRQAG
ncbi:MAG: hypothetical protein K0U84_01655 [Actinomycetia bacterium]|nr:hypothetical protein [Actinomycetes bacterium]